MHQALPYCKAAPDNQAMLDEKTSTADALRERFVALFETWKTAERGRSQAEFARLCARLSGRPCSPQAVSEWRRTGRMDKAWIPVVEQLLGASLGFSATTLSTGVAQYASLKAETVDGIRPFDWELLVNTKDLPTLFSVAMNDDSMAPRVRAGDKLVFNTSIANNPRPGDGVLVKDMADEVYFRLFRSGRQGHWEAHAMNPAYAALDSERDGLRILAVLTAVEARWG